MKYRFIPNNFEEFKNIDIDTINLVEERAIFLFNLMSNKNWDSYPTQNELFLYFKDRHLGNRLDYSIKSSVSILLIGINESNKKELSSINLLDYGAGFSTVFLLSSLLNINTYVNDLFESFQSNIIELYNFLKISPNPIYICGEANNIVQYFNINNMTLDIILSRNVIEHIYDYKAHLQEVKRIPFEDKLIILDSTTANYANPLVFLQHKIIHFQNSKLVDKSREEYIKNYLPSINEKQLAFLVKKLRNIAKEDLKKQLDLFHSEGHISHKINFSDTNICEPLYGCWTERLEDFSFYKNIFKDLNISLSYSSGSWITNYSFPITNIIFKLINKITEILPNRFKIITGPTLILIGTISKSKK